MFISTYRLRNTVNASPDGSSCSALLLHQVLHVSPVTLDLVIHVIPPPSARLNLSKVA